MVTMLLLFSRKPTEEQSFANRPPSRKAMARQAADRRKFFLDLRDDVRFAFARSSRDGRQNLIESEERCADAPRLQPRVAERGTSILLMARPTGVIRLLAATT